LWPQAQTGPQQLPTLTVRPVCNGPLLIELSLYLPNLRLRPGPRQKNEYNSISPRRAPLNIFPRMPATSRVWSSSFNGKYATRKRNKFFRSSGISVCLFRNVPSFPGPEAGNCPTPRYRAASPPRFRARKPPSTSSFASLPPEGADQRRFCPLDHASPRPPMVHIPRSSQQPKVFFEEVFRTIGTNQMPIGFFQARKGKPACRHAAGHRWPHSRKAPENMHGGRILFSASPRPRQ